MSNHTTTRNDVPETEESLTEYDIVLLDHSDLEEFITSIGVENIPEHTTIFTEDTHTRNSVEFNLIVIRDDTYGIATQLHHPVTSEDTVLDLRGNTSSFADYITGLQ